MSDTMHPDIVPTANKIMLKIPHAEENFYIIRDIIANSLWEERLATVKNIKDTMREQRSFMLSGRK